MDINKISSHLNEKINSSDGAEKNHKTSDHSVNKSENNFSDKVSLDRFSNQKSVELFAKIELEKLNQGSFDKLKAMKAKISEFEAAQDVSQKDADETEIGKMLNDPGIWEEIANKIID